MSLFSVSLILVLNIASLSVGQDIISRENMCHLTAGQTCQAYSQIKGRCDDLEQRLRQLEFRVDNGQGAEPMRPLMTGGPGFDGEPINKGDSRMAKDCHDLFQYGYTTTGIYRIRLTDIHDILVPCRMDHDWLSYYRIVDKRGWIVIQRRNDATDFDKDLTAYKNGFGHFTGSFWLGLNVMHELMKTNNGSAHIYVRLQFNGNDEQCFTEQFTMDDEDYDFYMVKERGHHCPKAKNMSLGTGAEFYTKELKQSRDPNCPNSDGGWWMYGMLFCQYMTQNPNSKFEAATQEQPQAGIPFEGSVITWTEILLYLERL